MKPSDYINLKTILVNNSVAHRKALATHINHQSSSSSTATAAALNQSLMNASTTVNTSINSATSTSTLSSPSMTSSFLSTTHNSSSPTINNALNNTTPSHPHHHPQPQKIMTLRRSSTTNSNTSDPSAPSLNEPSVGNQASSYSSDNQQAANGMLTSGSGGVTSKQYNKLIMDMLQMSFPPDYFKIPRSTRKRILRFLCDNGWIDVA